MSMAMDLIVPPIFKLELLPEQERDPAWLLQNLVGRLAAYVRAFQTAIGLFDHADALAKTNMSDDRYCHWRHIAARDGAMTIYHFGCVLLNGSSMAACPSLQKLIVPSPMRTARQRFKSKFPNANDIRNVVAHDAEVFDSPKKIGQHALGDNRVGQRVSKTKSPRLAIQNSLLDRSLQTTYEGRIISYDLSVETSHLLSDITAQFYSGFEPIERFPLELRQLIAKASKVEAHR
jgi:hypothetical protein